MDDKYYTYTFASGPDGTSFIANALIQWLLWPFRVILEVLFGSPFSNIISIDVNDGNF